MKSISALPFAAVPSLSLADSTTDHSSSGSIERDPMLVTLIEAHNTAWQRFEDVYELNDKLSPNYDPVHGQALWDWHNDAEEEARVALLAYRTHSIADLRSKSAYLLKCQESDYLIQDNHDLQLFLLSL